MKLDLKTVFGSSNSENIKQEDYEYLILYIYMIKKESFPLL